MNATSVGLALELVLWTLQGAILLVALVAAIVGAVANGDTWCAVAVLTLEDTWATLPLRAGLWLVGSVFAVFLAVAPEINQV